MKLAKDLPKATPIVYVLRPPPIFVVGIAMVFVVVVGETLSRALSLQRVIPLAVLGVIVGVPLIMVLRRRRARKAPKDAPIAPAKKPDESYRLRVMGNRHQVNMLGELRAAPFEPVIAPVYFALRGNKAVVITAWVIVSLAVCAGYFYVKRHLGWIGGGHVQFYEWWACFGLTAAPLAFFWPTYVRVSPGRLDVFEYGPLGSGTPRVTTYDLRLHRVLINLPGSTIILTPDSGESRVIDLGMWSPKPYDLYRAVFEAARWKHERPALPDDELIG